jgi:hypothetical protein
VGTMKVIIVISSVCLMLAGTTISENENIVAFRTTQIDHKLILLY